MAKYLIEVPHEATKEDCVAAVQIFMRTGSHFLTHADWGCLDGQHKAWIVIDADSKEQARNVLPPVYRARASVVCLNKFALDASNAVISSHDTVP